MGTLKYSEHAWEMKGFDNKTFGITVGKFSIHDGMLESTFCR